MIRWQFSGRTSAPLSPLQRRFDDFLTIDMGRCALFLWLASQIAGQLLTIAFVYLLLYLSAISREPCVSYGHEPPFTMVAIFPRNFCPMPMTSKLKKTTQLSAQQTFQVCGPICIFVRICTSLWTVPPQQRPVICADETREFTAQNRRRMSTTEVVEVSGSRMSW